MTAIASVTGAALRSAVDGLGARSRAIADNIANVQTPGFQSRRVAFEEAVAAAARSGSRERTGFTQALSLEPTRLDGNNVNLDTETLQSIDTGLRYQLALRAVDDRFGLVRAALRTQG
ncbi:flagellar biosynthesis protein FlgB [Aquipuribacter nitratireducens]|uniref:Flagellar basal body rod protein FlgB n=1 Tax=Aquipuribacter nitratireducens TaxID=650104 RepID=A0ABW0GQE4_9MICO